MKIFISFTTLLILLSTQSCKDDKLVEFARDVIDHPEKLYNLQKNYPEFYNPDYIYPEWSDTTWINNVIQGIKEYDTTHLEENIRFITANKSYEHLLYQTKAKDYNLKDFHILILQKGEQMILFELIQKEDKYSIFMITKAIDYDYLSVIVNT